MVEPDKALNVSIVGGGPGCKAIMAMIFREKLSELPLNLIGVACTNTKAVGYLFAKKKGIYTTTDYRKLYKLQNLDMIIELTGRDEVAAEISQNKPAGVRLMDHVTARLFWDLFQIEEESIAERKKAQAALEAAEHQQAAILGSLVELVFYLDTDLKILWANRAACESLDMALEEALGRHCYELWRQREEPCSDCPIAKAMKTGTKQHIEKCTPDCGAWYVGGNPVRDEEGHIVGAVEVRLDITERKRAEQRLLRITEAVDSSSDAVGMADPQGHHFYQNKSFTDLFDYETAEELEAAGGVPTVYVDQAAVRDVFDTIMAGKSWVGETEMVSKSGRRFPVLLRADAIKDEEGNIIGLVGFHTDITERKSAEKEQAELEARFRQIQRLESIGTLAGGIAHDFNNILMGIQGNASMMLLDMNEDDQNYERIRNIERQVQSGARLTAHLLGYARKGKYEVKPFSLNQLVEEASYTFGRTRKEVTIHQRLSEDVYAIEGDPGQIEQVLLNLFVNAAEAMPDGGDVFLETMNVTDKDMVGRLYKPKQGNYVLLKMRDTGAGMDKDTADRIFEPFFTTKEMGRGTGLGLASAYGIVKAHEGYIDVDSRKGHGTTFSIYLPASKRRVREAVGTPDKVVKGTETVLLADDEWVVRKASQDLLEAMGYQVLIARDGKEAIEIYKDRQDEIDIVLLDIIMPNMGGSETYQALKEMNPDVKVLLFSGYSINGEASEILEMGADAFIQKPFNMKELSGKIREVLDKP